jgi:hypothetical protein
MLSRPALVKDVRLPLARDGSSKGGKVRPHATLVPAGDGIPTSRHFVKDGSPRESQVFNIEAARCESNDLFRCRNPPASAQVLALEQQGSKSADVYTWQWSMLAQEVEKLENIVLEGTTRRCSDILAGPGQSL